LIPRTIGQTDYGLYKVCIIQGLFFFSLELNIQGLPVGDQKVDFLFPHCLSFPYSASSSRTCIGRIIAFTDLSAVPSTAQAGR